LLISDDTLLTDAKYAIRWDFNPEIGNGISLAVTKASNNGFFVIRKDLIDGSKQFDFELVWSLLYNFPPKRDEIALGTHEERTRRQFHAI